MAAFASLTRRRFLIKRRNIRIFFAFIVAYFCTVLKAREIERARARAKKRERERMCACGERECAKRILMLNGFDGTRDEKRNISFESTMCSESSFNATNSHRDSLN